MNFVGWSNGAHARLLLKQLKLWEKYGASGWSRGQAGSDAFMGGAHGKDGHQTQARNQKSEYLTASVMKRIARIYELDYTVLKTVGLVPGGPPTTGARWQPRSVRCPGPFHAAGIPIACHPGPPIPATCLSILEGSP
eukprot:Hpha_TRINITY_DN9774_c0_g1::TRINITY_DN9774_c0_g1_i2::g.10349::m.10349